VEYSTLSDFLCASDLTAVQPHQQATGAATNYHRPSPLLTYYIGNVGHVPGGAHGFLVIFLGPASYCK